MAIRAMKEEPLGVTWKPVMDCIQSAPLCGAEKMFFSPLLSPHSAPLTVLEIGDFQQPH